MCKDDKKMHRGHY